MAYSFSNVVKTTEMPGYCDEPMKIIDISQWPELLGMGMLFLSCENFFGFVRCFFNAAEGSGDLRKAMSISRLLGAHTTVVVNEDFSRVKLLIVVNDADRVVELLNSHFGVEV